MKELTKKLKRLGNTDSTKVRITAQVQEILRDVKGMLAEKDRIIKSHALSLDQFAGMLNEKDETIGDLEDIVDDFRYGEGV